MKVVVHHDEIGLKKGNFPFFEKKLVENIRKSCKKKGVPLKKIARENKRILCEFSDKENKKEVEKVLKNIFGIRYFAFVNEVEKDFAFLEKNILDIFKEFNKQSIKKIAFSTKRSDKEFELNSLEINKKLGEGASDFGLVFDYNAPEETIYIEISDKIYTYTKRFEGFGGLPVGTSGKVLCLLSGGIDSPVAAWMMMKRGCSVDFLHFHAFQENEKVFKKDNVVLNQVKQLNRFQPDPKLYTLPYSTYTLNVGGKIYEEYDLVMFKHYMLKTAEALAKKKRYDAIITGDNLAQVASQTIENLGVASNNTNALIFRPLIGMNKQEIIDVSKKIGLYKTSIQNYKDCCSIISRNPSTRTKQRKFKRELDKINLDSLVEKSLEELSEKRIKTLAF